MRINTHNIPAYVITNDSTQEYVLRGENSIELLSKLGYGQIIKYKGVNAPIGGCDKSHLKLLSDPNVTTPFILFEDDIMWLKDDHVFDIPDDADALYLGTSNWSRAWNFWMRDSVIYDNVSKDIVKINNMLCTHAIVILTDSYRDVMRRCNAYSDRVDNDYIAGDQYIVELMKLFNVYAVNDPVYAQHGRYNQSTIKTIRSSGWTTEESQAFYNKFLRPYFGKSMEEVLQIDNTHYDTRFEPLRYT